MDYAHTKKCNLSEYENNKEVVHFTLTPVSSFSSLTAASHISSPCRHKDINEEKAYGAFSLNFAKRCSLH